MAGKGFTPTPKFKDSADTLYQVERFIFNPPEPKDGVLEISGNSIQRAYPVKVIAVIPSLGAPRCEIDRAAWQRGSTEFPTYGAASDPKTQLLYSIDRRISGFGFIDYQWSPRLVRSSDVKVMDDYVYRLLNHISVTETRPQHRAPM
jgi:hypothetical protein